MTTTRIPELQAKMAETETDLVVLAPGAHMVWALDVRPHADERPCLAFVSQNGAVFLMPALEAESARAQTDLPFHTWSDDEGPGAALTNLLTALGAAQARTLILDETMRADHAALVTDALPAAARRFTEDTVGALRMRKDSAAVATLRRNAAIADAAMQAAWAAMRPGLTETEVADVIRGHFAAAGAKPLFSIVGAGPNGAYPHHHTGETVLKAGDAVVMDLGGGIDGYSSDITRMALIGDAPDGYDEVHAVVEAAVQAALAAARPGVKAREVDAAARSVIADAGYGAYFVHRTGHGLGTEVHEPPYITASSDTVLDEGMVFSIEPGIYLPGRFGIRLEDIVVLRADGPEILSALPRDAVRIDV
ncbi:M24 family metallopeptidase [Wenxinia saemankumensis]|uniref:Xaa-Pro aminopeptidase n=1 Tax=Wenxinia saemankumensis TaxID=1447782 RepID=A0A1M6I0Y3_9RHOB|nr:Xaa-Pro peptidase family protein [Wenxinia saemankumensis]SHJ28143.1 Xaa-Pro aminopeptidase [Wenxinia saemankumensis]